jgi:hypothetical protein
MRVLRFASLYVMRFLASLRLFLHSQTLNVDTSPKDMMNSTCRSGAWKERRSLCHFCSLLVRWWWLSERISLISAPTAMCIAAIAVLATSRSQELEHNLVPPSPPITRQASTISTVTSEPPGFFCSIHQERHPINVLVRVKGCDHGFCRDGLKEYICSKLADDQLPLCPMCMIMPSTEERPPNCLFRFPLHPTTI